MSPVHRRVAAATTLLLALLSVPSAGADAAGSGPEVLGLGDSVMSGYHCGCDGIPVMYGGRVTRRTGVSVRPVNLGVNGATTSSLLADLDTSEYDDAVRSARVVLLDIGANDLQPALTRWRNGGCDSGCYDPMISQMRSRLDRVLDRVNALRSRPSQVLVATYWNVFTDGKVALQQGGTAQMTWSRRLTRTANGQICDSAQAHDFTCVPLYPPFILWTGGDPTPLLASDGDHPDLLGSRRIARRFARATRWSLFG